MSNEREVILAAGAALERERIADAMREQHFELVQAGHIINPELTFLKKWIDYLSYPHRRNCDLPSYLCPDCVEEDSNRP